MLAVALVAALVVAGWREWPQWRPGGARPIAASSLSHAKERLVCPATNTRIAIFGDSHVAGTGGDASVVAFGRIMQAALPGSIKVDLWGAGGDTAAMGAQRWLGSAQPMAGLVILAYGTNDAAPRGWLRARQPVPLAEFEADLFRQISHWQDRGAQVALMVPPPGGSGAMADRLQPYRETVARVGVRQGLAVLDPAEAFAKCSASGPLLDYDGLHMSAAGHRCLGQWLAAQLCPAAP